MSRDQKLLFWEALPSWWLQCTTKCLLLFPALGCVSLIFLPDFTNSKNYDDWKRYLIFSLWHDYIVRHIESILFLTMRASKSHLKYTVMLMINVFAMSKVSRHEKIQCSKYLVVNTMHAEYEFTHNTAHSNP